MGCAYATLPSGYYLSLWDNGSLEKLFRVYIKGNSLQQNLHLTLSSKRPVQKVFFIIIPIFQKKESRFEDVKLGVKTKIASVPGKNINKKRDLNGNCGVQKT